MDTADVRCYLYDQSLLESVIAQVQALNVPKDIAAGPIQLQVLFNAHIVHVETTLKYGKRATQRHL